MLRAWLGVVAICAALSAGAGAARAETIEEFYKGRKVRFIVGSNTGGSYDSYSRLLAAHMGKHLPGSPILTVENMPGASGMQSANYLSHVAAKDGSVLAMFNQSMPQRQMLEPETIRFDVGKFSWIGAMGNSVNVFVTWHTSGVRTLDDARRKEVVMGALSSDGGNAVYPLLLNKYLGTRFKVVLGYPGGNTIQLAMERGEVDGRGSVVWSGFKANWPHWIAEQKVNVLMQVGLAKDPDLADVPLLLDLAKSPEEASIFRFISSDGPMQFPVLAPPGIPPDRLAALRKAFAATMTDPDFIKASEERKLPIRYTSGEEVEQIVSAMISTPKDVIGKLKQDLADAEAGAEAKN
jgi:tripartite-type tricarboxylate transporter receptor subunit TctC